MIHATQADIDRFMRYVDKLPNGCWFWTGARSRGKGNKKWYGSFRVGKHSVRAHRFSCDVLKKQPCPPGYDRDHTCRFSLCVCPEHIEVVTKVVNQERRRPKHQPSAQPCPKCADYIGKCPYCHREKDRAPGIDPKTGEYSTVQMLYDELTMGDTSKPLFD
jgi:hypothetical protein